MHGCAHCPAIAAEWAYTHTAKVEQVGMHADQIRTYSLSVDDYIPLCVPCHRRFDDNPITERARPASADPTPLPWVA